MRIAELLVESQFSCRHGTVELYRNLAVGNLLAVMERSPYKSLRGLIVGHDVFWWDAGEVIHSDVAGVYDPDFHDMERIFEYKKHRLMIHLVNGEPEIISGSTKEEMAAIPPLSRLMMRDYPIKVTMKGFS